MPVITLASSSPRLASRAFRLTSALVLASTLAACVIEDAPPRRLTPDSTSPYDPDQGSGSVGGVTPPPASPPTGTPSTIAPMLVVIDTDQVMDAAPGEGLGIFSEYSAGGKWHIWWTCDTALSRQECDVDLSASVVSGSIANVDAASLQGGTVVTSDPSRVEARIRTTTQVHGLTFTTDPGATLTLEATVSGLREGPGPNRSFFFFVQDGKINGGYTGALTNPLQLQGKTP